MGFNGMANGWQVRENNGAYCGFNGGTFGYNMKGLLSPCQDVVRTKQHAIAHGNPL